MDQTRINLSPINCTSLAATPLTGVWKDALQRSVKISQVLTTPAESLEIAIPSFACRVTDMTGAEVSGGDSKSFTAGPVSEAICQNLIHSSLDDEIRDEENTRDRISLVCPLKVSMRHGPDLVMSQM